MKKKLPIICLLFCLILPLYSQEVKNNENCKKVTVDDIIGFKRVFLIEHMPVEDFAKENNLSMYDAIDFLCQEDVLNHGILAMAQGAIKQIDNDTFYLKTFDNNFTVEYIDNRGNVDVTKMLIDKLEEGYKYMSSHTVDVEEMYSDETGLPLLSYLSLVYYVKEFISQDFIRNDRTIFIHGCFYFENMKLKFKTNLYEKNN